MKKKPIILLIGLVLLLSLGVLIFAKTKLGKENSKTSPSLKAKTKVEELNVIPVDQRPYIYLTPMADGRNVKITLKEIKKPALNGEYELEYQTGTLLQGAFGALKLDKLPFEETTLFGSCSAGGACTYHSDIKGGNLLTRFITEDGKYVLKSDWRYFDNKEKADSIASKDAKFQLKAKELSKSRYGIVFNAPGYPSGLEGRAVSDQYSLQTSSVLTGKAELTLRANEEGSLEIATWNGSKWQYYQGTIDGKTITATVDLAELYLVVIK